MKKSFFATSLALILLLLLSCEKDETSIMNTETKNGKGFKILKYGSTSGRFVTNNILSFESEEAYNTTLDSLENAFDNYQIEFTNRHQNMSDEELNDLVRIENIDLEEPLTNFEKIYSFHSLRNRLNNEEKLWLQNPDPNFNECPQFHPIESHVERSLWNEKGEIMIAGKLFKYNLEETEFIKIEDGDFEKLILINDGDLSVFSDENVFVENITNYNTVLPGECTRTKTNNSTINHYNYRMLIGNRLKPKSWEFGKHHMYGSTYTYRNVNGTWYNFVSNIYVGCTGNRYHGCTTTSPTTINKSRRASSVVFDFKRDNSFSVKYSNQYPFNYNWSSMVSKHGANSNGVNLFPATYYIMNYAGPLTITTQN